ncbi:MAG: hypothetical protein ACRDPF_30605 [Streptosporangiaceae bacterium]
MTGNEEEKNRVLGFPARPGRHPGQREEQHVMGFPASWFDDVNVDALAWLVHPVRQYRRRARRRRSRP